MTRKKILFAASLLFGLVFINAGLNKFFNYMPVPEDLPTDTMQMFTAITQIGWLMPIIGAAEVVGGVLFFITKTRALGAVILAPIMAGILLTHLTVAPEGLPIVLPLLGIYLWAIYENWDRYLPMIK